MAVGSVAVDDDPQQPALARGQHLDGVELEIELGEDR